MFKNFKLGFKCQNTVIFGKMKDGSLMRNTLSIINLFHIQNLFQNGGSYILEMDNTIYRFLQVFFLSK